MLGHLPSAPAAFNQLVGEIEISKHLSMVPRSTLAKAGLKATYHDSGTLPFMK